MTITCKQVSHSRKLLDIKRSRKRRLEANGSYPNEWNKLPVTRQSAKTVKPYSPQYFNANPCKNNHLAPRYTSSGHCSECIKVRQKIIDTSIKEARAQEIIRKEEYRECPECKKLFLILPSYQQDKIFCSKKCSGAEAKRNWLSQNPELRKVIANTYTNQIISEGGERYEKMRKRSTQYKIKRYKEDPAYKLIHLVRSTLLIALKDQSLEKEERTLKYLGCSINEFKEFIRKQFKVGMKWENHNINGWHLDHVRPCKSFDLNQKEQFFTCFNFRNYQPLWAKENIQKKDKYSQCSERFWIQRMLRLGFKGELFPVYLNSSKPP